MNSTEGRDLLDVLKVVFKVSVIFVVIGYFIRLVKLDSIVNLNYPNLGTSLLAQAAKCWIAGFALFAVLCFTAFSLLLIFAITTGWSEDGFS